MLALDLANAARPVRRNADAKTAIVSQLITRRDVQRKKKLTGSKSERDGDGMWIAIVAAPLAEHFLE